VLEAELAGLLKVRCIAGDRRGHTRREAVLRLYWAQLLVIWGSTPLYHKVSSPYTNNAPPCLPVIRVAHRGVEALCRETVRQLTW
jgi:hypothetical protein